MFLKGEFSNRLVQVSLFSGIVYYITAYPVVFEKARKYFPVKFKKTHHLLIFHTFVFAVLMYLLTYFVFDPIVRVVEGSANESGNNDNRPGNNDMVLGDKVTLDSCPPNTYSVSVASGHKDKLICEDARKVTLHTFTCTGVSGGPPKMWSDVDEAGSATDWTCIRDTENKDMNKK